MNTRHAFCRVIATIWFPQTRLRTQQIFLVALLALAASGCANSRGPVHVTTPNDVQARTYNDRGITLGRKGQYGQAVSEFNKAVELSPIYASAYFNRGLAYLSMGQHGQYDLAIADFTKVIELGKETERASSTTVRGAAYVPKEQYAETYFHRGRAYLRKAQYGLAITDFTMVLEMNPKDAQAYNNRGIAYMDKGEYEQAVSDFDKALNLNPRYALAYMNRGVIHCRKGDDDMAISDLTKALEIDAGLALAYSNRGRAYGRKGQPDEALSDFKKALEINPSASDALDGLGRLYTAQRKYAEAEPFFKKSLAIIEKTLGLEHPDVADTLEGYAFLLRKMHRDNEAETAEGRARAIRAKKP